MIYNILQDDTYLIHIVPPVESMQKLGEQYGTFAFNPDPVSYQEVWSPLEIEFSTCEKHTQNIIPDLSENYGRLYMNEKAHMALCDLLTASGEFLLVTSQGQQGYIFNPLHTAEQHGAVNAELLGYDEHGNLVHYGFFEEKLKNIHIFKTELDNCTRLFCSEVFKTAIEDAAFKGIYFNPDLANPIGKAYGIVQ